MIIIVINIIITTKNEKKHTEDKKYYCTLLLYKINFCILLFEYFSFVDNRHFLSTSHYKFGKIVGKCCIAK